MPRLPILLLLLASPALADPALTDHTLQAQVLAVDGTPVSGAVEVVVELFAHPDPAPSTPPLYAELQRDVPVEEGLMVLRLGSGEPISGTAPTPTPDGAPRYVRLWVDGQQAGPMAELDEPIAPWAPHAVDLPAPGLRVFDADGQPIGVYSGERIWGSRYLVHRPGLGLTLRLGAQSGELDPSDIEVLWELPGCTGQAYVDRAYRGVVFGRDADGFVVGTATQTLAPLVVQSRRADLDTPCENTERLGDQLIPLTSIPEIDLELPAAAPLQAGLVGG